ncbi:MAG: hypothetical protein MUE68_09465 [Bacteroidetes bacterium]|jgi:hypothetical protein|nr:hypothetical protein [Bacteroidota bacterium]
MKRSFLLLAVGLLAGCAAPKVHDPLLVGTWQSSFLFIESADIKEGEPGWEYFVATPSSWERVTNMKPLRTVYNADGTFSADYRNLQDSLLARATGTWHTVRDSLYYFQSAPDTFRAVYQFSVVGDSLNFSGIVDWERDGKRNDKVTMTQLRWPRPDSSATANEAPRRVH